jgi:UDP-glucose 4-epimerase
MKILVTGSSGTIGTHLCERLLKDGHEIVGADWKPNKWSEEVDAITINVDLRDRSCILSTLPKDIDFVVHLAANARVYDLVIDPFLARDNFETLFNTLEYARKNGITRFMFASSREVYGNTDRIIYSADEALTKNCESPYTASKIGGEALLTLSTLPILALFLNHKFHEILIFVQDSLLLKSEKILYECH